MLSLREGLARYVFAVAIVAGATLVRWSLDPFLGDRAPYVVYIVSLTLTSWRVGAGPGLLSLVLGTLLADYFFIPPRFSLGVADGDRILGLVLFQITGLIIIVLAESQRVARRKAERSAREAIDRQVRLEAEIAERQRVESERVGLLAEQERLRAVAEEQSATLSGLFEQAPVGIALFDVDLRYVRANSHAVALSGQPIGQLIGRSLGQVLAGLVTDAQIAEIERIFQRVLKTGEPFSAKGWATDLARPGGEVVHSNWSIRRIERPGGQGFGLLKTSVDVTEDVHRELALREADRRKDEFLAVLAHELRNPLASIRNSLHLMKRPIEGTNSEAEVFDIEPERAMADRQVAHLARLIDDLMDVSRISRGRIELRKEPTDLVPILRRVVEAARSPIQERGHDLTVNLPDTPIRLEADPTRLEQVFGNLVNNAIKYTGRGGRIELSAGVEEGEVAVRVRDSGLGIEAGFLPRIFEMFVQDGHHRGHSEGGLGIGLGLSRTLVELHGGRISVKSDGPGLGSEFEVRLPVSKLAPSASASAGLNGNGRSRPRTTPQRRVLVVDDNEDAARSLARILTRTYGQEVRVAHDGPSALELAGEFRPEVVLLDIGLPGMDGCEVARRLRAIPELEEALLVALTGWGQEADRKRTEAAGIDHHLVKPVDPDSLGDLIAGAAKV